jgi:predicted acylesterase/phospholipase RssA
VEECINAYLALSKKVFDVDQVLGGVIPTGDDQCRFSHLTLERSIKDLIKERLGSEDIKLSAMTDQPGCRTFVVTKMAMYLNAPTELFRSYELEGFNSIDPAMWEAARATSAAPTFFRPINITPPGIDWVDGGLGSNNPSQIARDEAERIWPKSKSCCLVSLGTGHPSAVTLDVQNLETDVEAQRNVFQQIKDFVPKILSTIPGWKTVQNFPPGVLAVLKMASVLSSLITDSEAVDERLSHASERNQFPYFRFNVERQVGDIGLEDHTKSRQIAALSRGYLNQHTTRRKKMDCVKRLVAYHTFTRE